MDNRIAGIAVSLCVGLACGISNGQTMQQKQGDAVVAPDAPFTRAERPRVVKHLVKRRAKSSPGTSYTDISEKEVSDELAKWERACATGDRDNCNMLAELRVAALGLTPAERRVILRNLMTGNIVPNPDREMMAKFIDELEKKCIEGRDRYACEALVFHKTKTAGQRLHEDFTKHCAMGHKSSCDELKTLKR